MFFNGSEFVEGERRGFTDFILACGFHFTTVTL